MRRRSVLIGAAVVFSFAQSALAQYAGSWSGTTGQSKEIKFTISGNSMTVLRFGFRTTTAGCIVDVVEYDALGSPETISGNSFSFTDTFPPFGISYTITGTFSTPSNASGTLTFNVTAGGLFNCSGSGSTTWSATKAGGTQPPQGTLESILAVASSTPGAAGSFFKTAVQLHNPTTSAATGRLVFHRAGTSGTTTDPALAFTLQPGQTIYYDDLLPAMNQSGLGSVDLYMSSGSTPIALVRVFNDGGASGTSGMSVDFVPVENVLRAGDEVALIAPPDPVRARYNIGIRSLSEGASLMFTVRDSNGVTRTTVSKTYGPDFFEQVSAASLLGVTPGASDTITISINSGQAVIYGAATDNTTQDPTLQFAQPTR